MEREVEAGGLIEEANTGGAGIGLAGVRGPWGASVAANSAGATGTGGVAPSEEH